MKSSSMDRPDPGSDDSPWQYPSPDGHHIAVFRCAGEVQMGTLYFELLMDGQVVRGRDFGGSDGFDELGIWSDDSRYFVAQEWLSTSRARGPETRLFVVDMVEQRACTFGYVARGFAKPLAFEHGNVVYQEVHFGPEGAERSEPLPEAAAWSMIKYESPHAQSWRSCGCLLIMGAPFAAIALLFAFNLYRFWPF